MEVMNMNM